jgi:hypothetical protein
MKKYLAVLVVGGCLVTTGCGLQQRFPKTQLEADTEACAYGVVVPHNYDTPQKRAHFVNDIAVPACLHAKGYDIQPANE